VKGYSWRLLMRCGSGKKLGKNYEQRGHRSARGTVRATWRSLHTRAAGRRGAPRSACAQFRSISEFTNTRHVSSSELVHATSERASGEVTTSGKVADVAERLENDRLLLSDAGVVPIGAVMIFQRLQRSWRSSCNGQLLHISRPQQVGLFIGILGNVCPD